MKKFLLTLVFGYSFSALAQTTFQPYYFSDKLKDAVRDCTPYSEDILAKNPQMRWAEHPPKNDSLNLSSLKMPISVQGKTDGGCMVSIKFDYSSVPLELSCSLSNEVQKKLLNAMNSKAPPEKKEIRGTVVSVREFDLVMMDIMGHSCRPVERKLSEEEQKELAHKMLAFSDKIKQSLKNCTPDKEKIVVMGKEINEVEIIGKEKEKCHVASHRLHILLNNDELSLSGFDELAPLLSDKSRVELR